MVVHGSVDNVMVSPKMFFSYAVVQTLRDSIYRVPLQAPATMLKELKRNAIALDPLLSGIIIRHPLVSDHLLR